MKSPATALVVVLSLVTLLEASPAPAATVSYTANLHTSRGNPVYDILILESDGAQQVHASVYPSELPGRGVSAVSHDVSFTPVRTLVIGLTEGKDVDGSDKTQIVMFLDGDFAAAHAGVPFSSIFAGARHSETIARLQAAVGGDAGALAWFTDTFFPGPAAGAAFASRGPFTVAEFTSLTIIGANAVAGNWGVNSLTAIPFNGMGAQSGRATVVVDETATDGGPFDIAVTLGDAGQFAVDKTVENNSGFAWRRFEMQLGTGSGAGFVPSSLGDGLFFFPPLNNREETGAFPDVSIVGEDRIVFTGFLPPGGTAHFVVFVQSGNNSENTVTVRQIATGPVTAAPATSPWSLVLMTVLLCTIGALRMSRRSL